MYFTINKEVIDIIRAYLLNEDNKRSFDIDSLLSISNSLNISGLVCSYLNRIGIKDNRIDSIIFNLVSRSTRYKHEIEEIDKVLKDYEYVYIKGHTLSKYYDEDYIRRSSDIDIVCDKYEEIKNLLINKLNYKEIDVIRKNETTLVKKDISIDLHFRHMKDEGIIEDTLKNALVINHELSDEYKYFEVIAHSYKHFSDGLFELKALLDLYYLRKNELDYEFINELLNKCNLIKYHDSLINYLNSILTNNYDEISKQLEDYVFNMIKDSGRTNKVLVNNEKNYVLKRIFLDYETLSSYYPVLKRHKVLMPYYEIKRMITVLKNKRLNSGINEVKAIKELNKEDYIKIEELKKNLGI